LDSVILQGWSVPLSLLSLSDIAFRPFAISLSFRFSHFCTRVQKTKGAIGFANPRRKSDPLPIGLNASVSLNFIKELQRFSADFTRILLGL